MGKQARSWIVASGGDGLGFAAMNGAMRGWRTSIKLQRMPAQLGPMVARVAAVAGGGSARLGLQALASHAGYCVIAWHVGSQLA